VAAVLMHLVLNGFWTLSFADHALNDMLSFIGLCYYALFNRNKWKSIWKQRLIELVWWMSDQ